ncbi:T9SS type A sorting domain-containing protein [Flavobacterium silvisoli]|uniref:T9SS type A sorting domain-containing protein n=1 Tax=Flavobacterium silvisoli TaxID=2529433 RepID=A0A4Q9Z0Z0_9FLAO|nr:T9SS type A sorting domain-containing protein [Flavobacterium silvisoli]TBX69897.1 T9SS type A sorting domain-containing protein [Flavobacterium silvisoli]
MKHILVSTILLFTIWAHAQSIVTAEYFWDVDPGQGNGNALYAADGNFNQAIESILEATASLPNPGNHILGIRIKTNDGNWGIVCKRVFRVANDNHSNNLVKITQAEYFWDVDPGQGNGNTMLAFDGNFNQALENILSNNTILPTSGNHILGIRVKADDGNWGAVFKKVLKVSENNSSNNLAKVTEAEYFWNLDPGQGNGNTMLAFDGNFNQAFETISVADALLPTQGLNVIHVRIKANDGSWGPVFSKVIGLNITFNSPVLLISPANNATLVSLNNHFVWNEVFGANTYEYQCATDNSFSNIVQSGITGELTAAFNTLLPDTTYFWRVRVNMLENVSLWSETWSFTTDESLGNDDLDTEHQIILTPNPASDYISIKLSALTNYYHYEIYASDSRTVAKGISHNNDMINIEKIASGMYITKITTDTGETYSLKFIKS